VVSSTEGFPRGYDTEVFSMETLKSLYHDISGPDAREHVTWDLYRKNKYTVHYLQPHEGEASPGLRLCVDDEIDFKRVESKLNSLLVF